MIATSAGAEGGPATWRINWKYLGQMDYLPDCPKAHCHKPDNGATMRLWCQKNKNNLMNSLEPITVGETSYNGYQCKCPCWLSFISN